MITQRPHYRSLNIIALFFAALLIVEMRLPLTATADSWLIGLWITLFYCALLIWLKANSRALQSEPWPFEIIRIDTGLNSGQPDRQASSSHE